MSEFYLCPHCLKTLTEEDGHLVCKGKLHCYWEGSKEEAIRCVQTDFFEKLREEDNGDHCTST